MFMGVCITVWVPLKCVFEDSSGAVVQLQGKEAGFNSRDGSDAMAKASQVILDSRLLANSHFLLKSSSAVSEFAIYYNKKLITHSYDFSIADNPMPYFSRQSNGLITAAAVAVPAITATAATVAARFAVA